jgi:hypothetical protein
MTVSGYSFHEGEIDVEARILCLAYASTQV